ncbi:MAG: hypothetical protein IKA02_01725 [Clostridia bacterium]|nr:hypothetical protein [Clostridia bacterium]
MKKTKQITFCGLMSAVSIVILLLGGITKILDITTVVICAMIIYVVFAELKYGALFVYFATALLTFALLPNKDVGIEYLIFAIYPIVKPLFEKTGKILSVIIKIVFMILMSATLTLLFRYIFYPGELWYIDAAFFVGLTVCYYLFDISLTRFNKYYYFILRQKLKIDRFFR